MFKLTLDSYAICKNGDIFNTRNGHKCKPQKNSKGYLRVSIGGKRFFVHKLVANKYIPNPENKTQVNHIDGNKENNCVENLEWVTNQENRQHAIKNGLQISGEKCSWTKLKEEDVLFIREHSDIKRKELAERFNVSSSTITDIRKYKSWKQLKRYAELSRIESDRS